MPTKAPVSVTSSAVTPAMAAPRMQVRSRCCSRLRKAITQSMRLKRFMSVVRLHRAQAGSPASPSAPGSSVEPMVTTRMITSATTSGQVVS